MSGQSFEMLLARRSLLFIYENAIVRATLVVPPVPVMDSSAGTVYDSLQKGHFNSNLLALTDRAFDQAQDVGMLLNGADRATGNLKYYAHRYWDTLDKERGGRAS